MARQSDEAAELTNLRDSPVEAQISKLSFPDKWDMVFRGLDASLADSGRLPKLRKTCAMRMPTPPSGSLVDLLER